MVLSGQTPGLPGAWAGQAALFLQPISSLGRIVQGRQVVRAALRSWIGAVGAKPRVHVGWQDHIRTFHAAPGTPSKAAIPHGLGRAIDPSPFGIEIHHRPEHWIGKEGGHKVCTGRAFEGAVIAIATAVEDIAVEVVAGNQPRIDER